MKLYITPDNIGLQSGGGIVTRNELEALKTFDNKSFDDSRTHINHSTPYSTNHSTSHSTPGVISIDTNDINPVKFGLPDTPFLSDYLTLEKLSNIDLSKISMAQLYAGPFGQTVNYLKTIGITTVNTYAAHDRKESIKEFENLGYEYPYNHVKNDNLWRMYFAGAKEADVLIAPSNLSKNFLRNEGCTQKIEIIPHGINIPDKVEPIPNQFNVGYLGATGIDKGLKYLIQSWSELNYKDSTLIFAGRDTEQLGPFINKYASHGRFHLAGWMKNIGQLYNNISVYVQPSVAESFGIEVIEAMSHGRPVIVSNGAGAADSVTEGVDGFIVNKRDPKAIVDKIQYFKDNPKELRDMGNNAKEKAKEYSWDKIREMYINLWRSLP